MTITRVHLSEPLTETEMYLVEPIRSNPRSLPDLVLALEAAVAAGGGTVADGSITTAKLAALAVTTAKIAAASVTLAKLAADAIAAFDAAGAAAAAQAASQPLDSDLTAIAALTTTTYGRALLTAADLAALVGLGLLDLTTAQTLTNKRLTKRVETIADAATITPSWDNADGGKVAALSQATTLANFSGTPTDQQTYMLRIKTATARVISFGNQFRGSTDLALSFTTSGGGLTDYLMFTWNAADSKIDWLAKTAGF